MNRHRNNVPQGLRPIAAARNGDAVRRRSAPDVPLCRRGLARGRVTSGPEVRFRVPAWPRRADMDDGWVPADPRTGTRWRLGRCGRSRRGRTAGTRSRRLPLAPLTSASRRWAPGSSSRAACARAARTAQPPTPRSIPCGSDHRTGRLKPPAPRFALVSSRHGWALYPVGIAGVDTIGGRPPPTRSRSCVICSRREADPPTDIRGGSVVPCSPWPCSSYRPSPRPQG